MSGEPYAELRDKAWLVKMYEEKQKPCWVIADLLGCQTSTVARAIRRHHITLRYVDYSGVTEKECENASCGKLFPIGGRGQRKRTARYCSHSCHMENQSTREIGSSTPRPKKNKDTLHNKDWLYEMYITKKMSYRDIAKLLGCSRPSVKWALRKFSIPRRKLKEAVKVRFDRRWRIRATQLEMIIAYGGKCACCGETEPAFLSLDHIGGGGSAHRKELGGQGNVRRELKRLGWPKDKYRLLCMNCNFAVRFNRPCPHQLARDNQPEYCI